MGQPDDIEESSLGSLDLSCFNTLKNTMIADDVQSQKDKLCTKMETVIELAQVKELVYNEAKQAVEEFATRAIQQIRTQEEQLLNELWVKHRENAKQYSRCYKQLSGRIQALLRLMDSEDIPTAMEWSLPTRTENTENIVTRMDDLEKLVEKIQAECGTVVMYTSEVPTVLTAKLGSISHCPVSMYTAPTLPVIPTVLDNAKTNQEIHSPSKVMLKDNPRVSALAARERSASDNVTNQRTEEKMKSADSVSMKHKLPEIIPLDKVKHKCNSEPNVQAATVLPVPAPRRQRKIHRSLSANTKRNRSGLAIYRQSVPLRPTVNTEFLFKLDAIGNGPGELKQPTDAAILPSGNIIVADYNNRRLQEFDLQGRSVQMFNYPRIKPKAVTMTKDKYVAVIDGIDKNIKTYTRGAELVCRFGTGYFRNPCDFAINSKDHYIIIDSYGSWQKTVFIYNPMTGTQDCIGLYEGSYIFSNPEGIAITEDDHILVTDAGHHCIFHLDEQGKFLNKIGQQGQGLGHFWYPKGICVDQDGNILVADCGNHRVCLLDKNGQYLSDILTKHHGVHFPINISTSPKDILVVVQNSEVLAFHVSRSQAITLNSTERSKDKMYSGSRSESTSSGSRSGSMMDLRSIGQDKSRMEAIHLGSTSLSVLKKKTTNNDIDEINLLEDGMLI